MKTKEFMAQYMNIFQPYMNSLSFCTLKYTGYRYLLFVGQPEIQQQVSQHSIHYLMFLLSETLCKWT